MTNRLAVEREGQQVTVYEPQPHQTPFHESNTSNLLALGPRGTGKSTTLRFDAIIRCLVFPNFRALILRRTIPDLRKSHLNFIDHEMRMLGGTFNWSTFQARFPNGSHIQFSHCEKANDVANFLSSEWGFIGFDEVSTFTLDMFLLISAAARSNTAAPYKSVVRCCSNPLGPGAAWMKAWFVDKNVNLEEYPDYLPDDFEMQYATLEQNKYVDQVAYRKRLRNLPEHVRKAWLDGEFVIEGAYFTDFRPKKDQHEWHVLSRMPTMVDRTTGMEQSIFDYDWLNIYRCLDWGYFPDPAVCLWIAVLPNKHEIVFKERSWKRTLAVDVAREIKQQSEGLHVIETFCDPSMFVKTGTIRYSIGELFEQTGVPLTPGQNDRELFGYAVHDHLNTLIDDHPQLQIVQPMGRYGCPDLIRTLPIVPMDPTNAAKLGNGEDHWVVALAYYCMGGAAPSRDPVVSAIPRWMQRKRPASRSIGLI